jgi:hypothetical protein
MLDSLITAIVRPLRAEYSHLELGPPRIRFGDVEYSRDDFNVRAVRFSSFLTRLFRYRFRTHVGYKSKGPIGPLFVQISRARSLASSICIPTAVPVSMS